MKLFRSGKEHGQVLVIIALSAIVIFGFVGLAIDGGLKFSDRRHAQNAADTAALAAALEKLQGLESNVSDLSPTTGTKLDCPPPAGDLPSDLCASLLTAGLDRANSNGYDNNPVTNTVEVYSPPISGYYSTVSDKDSYVQVIITSHVKTAFMSVLGIGQTDNIVQAVAYTKKSKNIGDGAMVISYDPHPNCSSGAGTNNGSVNVTGNATVTLDGGGIFVNSQENCGFGIPNCADLNIIGGAGINSAATVDNINQDGCTAPYVPATENLNQDPVAIPGDVYWPDEPPECNKTPQTPYQFPTQILGIDGKMHDQWLIYPGYYTEFPPASLVSKKSYIYLASDATSSVYCIDLGGSTLSWSSVDAAALNGCTHTVDNPKAAYTPTGVTLYMKNTKGFSINGAGPTCLDATNDPNSDYQGYVIILEGTPTTHPSCTINGGSDVKVNGLIYAPYCDFTINGTAGETATFNAQLVGWDITINGSNNIDFKYDPSTQVHIKRRIGLMK